MTLHLQTKESPEIQLLTNDRSKTKQQRGSRTQPISSLRKSPWQEGNWRKISLIKI